MTASSDRRAVRTRVAGGSFLVGAIGLYPGPWLEIVRPAAEAWAAGIVR